VINLILKIIIRIRLFYRMVNLKLSVNLLLCAKRKKLSAKNTDKRKSKIRVGHNTAHRFKEPILLPNMGT